MSRAAEISTTRREVQSLLCDLPAGFPREPTFDQPWEVRIFSVVLAAHRAGGFAWEEFQQRLAAADVKTSDHSRDAIGPITGRSTNSPADTTKAEAASPRATTLTPSAYLPWLTAIETIVATGSAEGSVSRPVTVPARRCIPAPVAVAPAMTARLPANRVSTRNPGPRRPTSSGVTTWNRRDWREAAQPLLVIAAMHVVAFAGLALAMGGREYKFAGTAFGLGLGLTAYVFGVRHAFDFDHIAAIDNTTRKLRAEGQRPKTVGLWFALGHSTTVLLLAGLTAAGVRSLGTLAGDHSDVHKVLGTISTLSSGGFLYLIGLLNLVSLVGIWRVFRSLRSGSYDETVLEAHLRGRGLLARIARRTSAAISRPKQMYAVGLLFGLGFDTATEIALLVLAGTGAATGVPWYVILLLPLLFAAGMCLFDCLDGLFMSLAYDWAFLNPVRKVYYNLTVTGLSVGVALIIGSIELASVLHNDVGWNVPVISTVSAIPLNNLGFIIVGFFALAWVAAVAYWRFSRIEERLASANESRPSSK
jgi:high-affinity nickel-transport protein